MRFFVRNSKNGPVRDYHWSVGPSATRFLFEIIRSRCFVRDCERLGKVGSLRYGEKLGQLGPLGAILRTGSLL